MVEFSIKHNISIIMLSIGIIILGSVIFVNSTFDFIPEISNTTITVETQYKNIGAKEVNQLITIPLEDSISSLKGLANLQSISRDEYSILILEIDRKFNIQEALQNAKNLIDGAYQNLPHNCSKPKIQILDNSSASFKIILSAEKEKDLNQIVQDQIIPVLSRNKTVGKIMINGGKEREIHVKVQENAKDHFKLNLEDIAQKINAQNIEHPAGIISNGNFEYQLITDSLITSIDEIYNLPLSFINQNIIKVKDVASVSDELIRKESFVIYNNCESILISVLKKKNTSPFALDRELKKIINEFNNSQDSCFLKIIENPSDELKSSLLFSLLAFIVGIIITFFVTKFFFNIRFALYIIPVIPWSVFCSTIFLSLTGNSINLISLCGITVGLGMVVDCPTVCANSIIKERNIIKGIKNVEKSNITSVLTTIIVFVPIMFLKGIYKELFTCFAVSVITSILSSLLYSETILPSLLKNENLENISNKSTILNLILRKKNGIISSKLKCTKIIYFISIVLIVLIMICIKKENIPGSRTKYAKGTIYLDNSTNMKSLNTQPIFLLFKNIGFNEILLEAGIDEEDTIKLMNPECRKKQVDFRITIKNKKDLQKIKSVLSKNFKDYKLNPEENFLQTLLNFKTITFTESNKNYTKFIPDQNHCSRFNITPQDLSRYIAIEKDGIYSTQININDNKIPVKIINEIEPEFNNIKLYSEDGFIELKNLGVLENVQSRELFYRINKKDFTQLNKLKPKNNGIILIYILSIIELFCILSSIIENPKFSLTAILTIIPGITGALLFLIIFKQTLNIFTLLSMIILMGTGVNNSIILYETIKLSSRKSDLITGIESIVITTSTTVLSLIPFAFDFLNLNNTSCISISIIGGLIFSALSSLVIIPGDFYGK